MGALDTMKKGLRNLDAGTGGGLTGLATATLAGGAASYGIGQAYHRYQDKWYGKHIAKITAGVGKLAAVVAMGMGHDMVAGVANAAGQAGIDAYFLEMGLAHARKATGKRAILVDAASALPAGASEATSVGALGQAAAGRGLSFDKISELASSMH